MNIVQEQERRVVSKAPKPAKFRRTRSAIDSALGLRAFCRPRCFGSVAHLSARCGHVETGAAASASCDRVQSRYKRCTALSR